MPSQLDASKLAALIEAETSTFRLRTKRSAELLARAHGVMPDGVPMSWMANLYAHPPMFVTGGKGASFEDVDGNRYIDFNLADLSNTIGYGENAVSRVIADQARRGLQFLLPGEDAIAVSEELTRRTGFPVWQYTLSASQANTEIIRIARAFTGRAKVVVFEGKYHGHLDTTLVDHGKPEGLGILPKAIADTVVLPFNDIDALRAELAKGDVALVLTEPMLTNCTLVLADPGFISEAHRVCQASGTLFALDETHTWQFAYGGVIRAEKLSADVYCLGKGLGTGVPLAAYGLRADLGDYVARHRDDPAVGGRGVMLGGTLFGNALGLAATRAGLEEILTEEGYARTARLGTRLADGIETLIATHGLPWCAFRYGPRSGFCLTPRPPRTYEEAQPSLDPQFSAARRVFMANRGIWEAIYSAAPQVSFAHTEADIDRYLAVAGEFLAVLGR